ncbi:RNA transcription [Durusdinium trenchii]|uniref:Translation and transport factor protein n=1 Tax=Durusdinium trenchii TaxID=1381693 RepID=A0ABP0KCS0_9DINO
MGGFYQGKGGKGGAAAAAAAPAAPAAEGGDGLPGGLKRKLQALGYPELGSVSLSGQAYMKVILWLEEEKIRLYEKIDRAPLRKFDKSWYEAVSKYAKELGVPADGLTEKAMNVKLNVLNGLTNLAVHDIYRDEDEANQLQNAVPQGSQGTQAAKQRLGELLPSLNSILQIFSLPQLPQDAQDTDILAGLKCVLVRVSPTSADEPTLDLQKLPLGVDVADPEVRKAVAVLRLLHGLELQQLQVNINTVINELQQLTANPQTDSRLGRVGR